MARYRPIHDYALIGDSRCAGLVSRDGSLDWLCLPRFDSPALLAALLDPDRGGRFQIRPAGAFRSERRYLPETNILETTFYTAGGTVAVRDLMPVMAEDEKRRHLLPEREVLREVAGLAGEVELEVLYEPRPDYGRSKPVLQARGPFGIWCQAGRAVLVLRGELPLALTADGRSARGVARLRAGQRVSLSLSYSADGPAVVPPLGAAARNRVERSAHWWRAWAGRCAYQGPYRAAVMRSLLVLKLMSYAPSGAIIAAPTTSLPEEIGGDKNWDYRYCWLRDASFTLRALRTLGYHDEGRAFVNWLLHATRLTWPELQVLYNVYGEARVPETELTHLAGYAGSRPVRVGNNAHAQFQLDAYGDIVDAAALVADQDGQFDRDTIRLLNDLGRTVCRRWREPDNGIWEARGQRRHYTHSKVLCWVALDRLIRLHEAGHRQLSAEVFREHRAAIRAEIEARGYNERLQSYTQTLDGDALDASLLVLPLYGYIAGDHPRMRATYRRILDHLGRGSLVFRYATPASDGRIASEGAFGICSFWAVEALAKGGERAAARRLFEGTLAYANDVGLFGEEIDPETGAALGNFPQAFTHIGLINAAVTLAEGDAAPRPAERAHAAVAGQER